MRNGGRHRCQPPLRRDLGPPVFLPSGLLRTRVVQILAHQLRLPRPSRWLLPSSRSPSPVRRFRSKDRPLLPGSAFAVRPGPKALPSCSGCLSDARSLQPRRAFVRSHLPGRGIHDLAIASSPPSPVHAALLGMTTPGCRPKPLREKRSFVRLPWRTITSSGASCLPCSGNPPTALGNLGIPPRVRFHSSACRLRSGSLVPARASFRSFRRRPLPPITLGR